MILPNACQSIDLTLRQPDLLPTILQYQILLYSNEKRAVYLK